MRSIKYAIFILFFLQLWILLSGNTTIIDSVYAIPELDGDITADSTGMPISIMNWTYEIIVGDIGMGDPWLDNGASRGYVTFPLPTIPEGYSLVNATLRLYQYTSRGFIPLSDSTYICTFFPNWNIAGGDTIKCIVSHIDYGNSLDLGDWAKGDLGNPNTYNPNVGEITLEGMNEPGSQGEAGYRYLDITDCVLSDLTMGNTLSQYRIAFQINTDFDYGSDYVSFLSANSNPEYLEFLPILYFTYNNPSTTSDELNLGVIMHLGTSPNPFKSHVDIELSLHKQAEVSIKLFDLKGRLVQELDTSHYTKGNNDINLETHNLSNGIYLLQVKAGNETITKKITCLK